MRSSSEKSLPMISVQNLTKRFGSVAAINGISFCLKHGEILALLGSNGAGKSTTLKCILGLAKPTSGQISILGARPDKRTCGLHSVSAVLASSTLHPGRTGWNTVLDVGLACHARKSRIREVFDICGLSKAESQRKVVQYSTGMRQRLLLAIALVSEPRLLILDEPEIGLDPDGQIWLRDFEVEFVKNGGTLLVSSHNLHAVASTAHRILFYTRGKIATEANLEKTPMQAKELEEMYLSISSETSRNASVVSNYTTGNCD